MTVSTFARVNNPVFVNAASVVKYERVAPVYSAPVGATLTVTLNVTKRITVTGYSNIDSSVQPISGMYFGGVAAGAQATIINGNQVDVKGTVVGNTSITVAAYNSLGQIISLQIPIQVNPVITAERLDYTVN